MMSFFRSWVLCLTGASMIAALAETLTPSGSVRRVTKFVCGIMLCAVLLLPELPLDREIFSRSVASYRSAERELLEGAEEREKEFLRPYIEEKTRTYILDEAQTLGIGMIDCAVSVKWREGSWVPYEVELKGTMTPEQRRALGEILDGSLGIPAERQHWE